jgi:23S rRNA pseudouridine1911/1915/1917 synthase
MEKLWQNETVAIEESGQRLDQWLSQKAKITRSQSSKWIGENRVQVDNVLVTKAGTKVELGNVVSWQAESQTKTTLKAEAIPIEILYEDEHLALVNKPAGLVVHPAAGHESGTLVNALLHRLSSLGKGIGGEGRPGIVHRIDKETSGVLLVTKTDQAHLHLAHQFHEHSVGRAYTALAWGTLPARGQWEGGILRDPKDRKRMALSELGRSSLTQYELEKVLLQTLSLFKATLHTGRTHQIRVHAAHHGYPLVGDSVYGHCNRIARQAKEKAWQKLARQNPHQSQVVAAFEAKGRQFLHAHYLAFDHPITSARMEFSCPLPDDLRLLMIALGHEGDTP